MAEFGLIIPGLGDVPAAFLGDTPRLRAWLSRCRALPSARSGVHAALHAAAGTATALEDLPAGPVAAAGDGLIADGELALAEPLTLEVHIDHVTLGEPDALELDIDEAERLADALNTLWRDEGLELRVVAPRRWYLCGEGVGALAGGLEDARTWQGMRLDQALESAQDGRRLRRLLTEAQMLFHQHAVNRLREQQGRTPVNGLWISGGGARPGVPGCRARLLGDQPFGRGLMHLDRVALPPSPSRFDLSIVAGACATWVCLPPLPQSVAGQTCAALATALQSLERDWVAPAWRALSGGRLHSLCWRDDRGHGGRLCWRRRWRLWARRLPPPFTGVN